MGIESIFSYILVCILAALSPGPGMVAVISYGANYGLRKTLPLMYGLLVGLVIMSIVVTTGIGLIIQTSVALFTLLRYVGAAYVAYLGILVLWNSSRIVNPDNCQLPQKSNLLLLQQGVLLAVANPKTLFFFSSLFPIFINPEEHSLNQLVVLVSLLLICTFCVHFFYVEIVNRAYWIFGKYQRLFNVFTGIIFILLSISLLIEK